MTKTARKLALRHETIRLLRPSEIAQLRGGAATDPTEVGGPPAQTLVVEPTQSHAVTCTG